VTEVKHKEIVGLPTTPSVKHRDTSELVSTSSMMDILTFEDACEEFENLQHVIQQNEEKLSTIERLTNDIHNILGRHNPTLKSKDEIAASHRHNRTIVSKIMGTNEFTELHNTTQGDEWATALATDSLIRGFMDNMDSDMLEQINEQGQQAGELDNQQQSLQDMVNGLQDMLDNNGLDAETTEKVQNDLNEAQQALQEVDAQVQTLGQAMETTGKAMGRMVRVAVKQAQKKATHEIENVQGLVQGWGTGIGDIRNLPTETKMALAEEMKKNRKLREIASQLGAMKKIATTKRKNRYGKRREEVYDITIGRDLSLLLPSEKVLLLHDQTKLLFFKRFTEGSLMQYAVRGKEKQGRGAIICAIDVSGSMEGLQGEIWSKVLALGLLEIAGREKRDFVVIFFDTDVRKEVRFPKDMKPEERIKAVLEIASFFTGGGTSFEPPLDRATMILTEKEFKKADVILITDGECDVGDNWLSGYLKWRDANKVTTQGILVGRPVHHLHKFCQHTYSIVDLFSPDENDRVHSVFTLMS